MDSDSALVEMPRRAWLALLGVAAFGAALAYNLVTLGRGEPVGRRPLLNIAIQATFAAALIAWYLHARATAAAAGLFHRWLREHAAQVRAGGASFGGAPITPETGLRSYPVCLSFLIVSVESRSRRLLPGEGRQAAATRALYTLGTLLLGWWALPFGPYRTFVTLFGLLRPRRETVGELLAWLAPAPGASPAPAVAVSPLWGLLRGAAIGVGIVASWLAVAVVGLWIGRDHVVFLDNSGDRPLELWLDGKPLGALAPRHHLRTTPAAGEHRIVARGPDGVTREGAFTVPPRRDPFIGFRGVYDVGGRGRYALVSRCYGTGCEGQEETLPLSVSLPFFEYPQSARASTDLDEPFPEQGQRGVHTHLCRLDAGGAARCGAP